MTDFRRLKSPTGLVTLALTRSDAANRYADELASATEWMETQLKNPDPDGPRYNRHESSDAEMPEFRNNLYTNAGHLWAFLATTVGKTGRASWER